ncbi:LysM peptidoglycan-binding domain-containing protein [Demequina silvatica]|uniref:LysM peptidoglycan-binding domain-containing protein n=1 Tax=Demequina silvatica TaxID=1638988 RepID=UPI000782DDBA|nr:LysM domain-containing protein [Demequina silvatica]
MQTEGTMRGPGTTGTPRRSRAGTGAAWASLAGTAAALGAATAASALAWQTAQRVDWRMWSAADAVLVGAGAVAALAATRFLIEVAAALGAIARGVAAPRWTGRLARATAAALAATLLGAGAAQAADPPPSAGWLPAQGAAASVPWTPATETPGPARIVPTPARPDRSREPGGAVHVVAPGESLWSITADALDTAEAAAVAEAWPALYRANREAIGEDPGLIHPGQRLALPAPLTGGAR